MTARKSKASNALGAWLGGLAGSEKGRYVLAGLALALVSTLGLLASREWTRTAQISHAQDEAASSKSESVSLTAKVSQLTETNRELTQKLEITNRSGSLLRKGKTTKGADGSESTEWEERQEFLEQILTQTQTEKDHALTRAEFAEQELRTTKLEATVLRSRLLSLEQEAVTHGGMAPALGLTYAFAQGLEYEDAIKLDLGTSFGPTSVSAGFAPFRVMQNGEYNWKLLAPSVRAGWSFSGH